MLASVWDTLSLPGRRAGRGNQGQEGPEEGPEVGPGGGSLPGVSIFLEAWS